MPERKKTGTPGAVKGAYRRHVPEMELRIPINLERAILLAAGDRAFREALLEDVDRALEDRGVELTVSERTMLATLSRRGLEDMIERFRPGRSRRARFAKRVAAAVAGSLIVTTAACGSDGGPTLHPDGGVDADWIPDVELEADMGEDVPPDIEEVIDEEPLSDVPDAPDVDDEDVDEDVEEETDG